MTRIFNDPSDFAEEALAGFCDIHSHLVRQVPGAVDVGLSTKGQKPELEITLNRVAEDFYEGSVFDAAAAMQAFLATRQDLRKHG